MAAFNPIPATPDAGESILPGSSLFEERADIQLIDLSSGDLPSRQTNYRAVRLLLVARCHAERLAVVIHVIRQGTFDNVADAASITPARAKELFAGLVHRESQARARVNHLRKLARRDARQGGGKGRRIGKHTPQAGPIIPRLSTNMTSHADRAGDEDAANVADHVGRTAVSDRRPGMSDTGDSEPDFPQDFQED